MTTKELQAEAKAKAAAAREAERAAGAAWQAVSDNDPEAASLQAAWQAAYSAWQAAEYEARQLGFRRLRELKEGAA